MTGRRNLVAGFTGLGLFMIYGFLLIYLRDFAPNAAAWAASYSEGKHFESRLAHVHGALFSLLNVLIGYLLVRLKLSEKDKTWISWSALVGLLMPIGIVLELVLGAPPVFVLIGAISITYSMFFFAWSVYKAKEL